MEIEVEIDVKIEIYMIVCESTWEGPPKVPRVHPDLHVHSRIKGVGCGVHSSQVSHTSAEVHDMNYA